MGLGVDRLSLSFPLDCAPDPAMFGGGRESVPLGKPGRNGRSYSVMVPISTSELVKGTKVTQRVDHSVFVGAAEIDGCWWGKVETNPSRYADPRGCSLLPVDQLEPARDAMGDLAFTLLPVSEHPDEWKVTRLDLARDFREVPDPSLFVRSLAGLPRPYARRSFTYRDPGRNRAETLAVGSNSGMVRLYDQHAAYASKGAPEGSLRWEVECRPPWLHGARLGDLDAGFLTALAEHRWEWSACGTRVASSSSGMLAGIQARTCSHKRPRNRCELDCGLLSPGAAQRLAGQYAMANQGVSFTSSDRTRRHYAREALRLGVVLDPEADGGSELVRLDWGRGTVIVDSEPPPF